jgi:DNA-binding response OmpR family regulator
VTLEQGTDAGRPVIVVADDDEDILVLVSFRLDRAGHEVLTARNGQEALDLICERRPDAAVLDVKMPKLTGIDVVKQVRERESVRDTPVILLSAGVQEDTIVRGFEAGANDYIRKPFSPDDLVQRLDEVLAGR